MIILAIDPGVTGALAFYSTSDKMLYVYDMPVLDGDVSAHELLYLVNSHKPHIAIVEHVSPMPKEGVRSVWRFSAAFTTACVIVKVLKVPLILVPPAKWKKAMSLKGGKEGKEQARERVIDLFPGYYEAFKLKKHHGRAEAAMLAVYASTLPTIKNHEAT